MDTRLTAIAFDQEIKKLTEGFVGRDWLFKDIDRWLDERDERFFILTGEPGVGKSAIAAQLVQTHEHIVAHHFCQAEDIDTLKPEQILRSLAAQLMKMETLSGYGQALLNTIKSPTLSANVKITYNEAANSEITEVFIENLQSANADEEGQEDLKSLLEVLIRSPLAALENYQDTLPEKVVILIDGLNVVVSLEDAAQGDEDLVTLLAALSEAENLPPWVRFILTSRPDRRVIREFEPLQEITVEQAANGPGDRKSLSNCRYQIDELCEANQADLRQYIHDRFKQPDLESLLAGAPVPEQSVVDKLTQQSEGNFRYVCSVLDECTAETLTLNHFPFLPAGLKQLYAQEWFASTETKAHCLLIFQKLAEEEGFITEDDIVTLTEILPRHVRQALWGLRQFLDTQKHLVNPEKVKEGFIESFAIFHPSFREYICTHSPE